MQKTPPSNEQNYLTDCAENTQSISEQNCLTETENTPSIKEQNYLTEAENTQSIIEENYLTETENTPSITEQNSNRNRRKKPIHH